MRSALLRAIIVTHVIAICPVLFTACGGKPEASAVPAARAEGNPAPAPADATVVRHVDAAGAKKLLAEQPDVVVIDVRTPDEFAGGHLAGAKNLDFNVASFPEKLSQLDREKTYLVHCAAGGRSTRSLARFKELGFKSVVHLDGGYTGWDKAGLPVEK